MPDSWDYDAALCSQTIKVAFPLIKLLIEFTKGLSKILFTLRTNEMVIDKGTEWGSLGSMVVVPTVPLISGSPVQRSGLPFCIPP